MSRRVKTPRPRRLRIDHLEDRSLWAVQPITPADPSFATLAADNPSSLPTQASSISPDGQLVAFVSRADDLVPNDANGHDDVFLHNVATGEVRLLSVAANGFSFPFPSSNPKFSPDGRYVLYDRAGDLFINPGQVHAYDLQTGTNIVVSVSSDEVVGNSASDGGSWSGDGTKVAFKSAANNLVPGDTNGYHDIFVRDLVAGTTTRASVAQDGTQAQPGAAFFEALSFNPRLNGDGRFVVFQSTANNLGPTDANASVDIYVKDLQTGAVDMVTLLTDGVTQASANATLRTRPISDDGRYVVFEAPFASLGGNTYVLLRDRLAGTTSVVSVNAAGTANRDGVAGVITPDGQHVAFISGAGDLDPTLADTNAAEDVFVRDLAAGTTRLVSRDVAGTNGGNGRTGFGLHPNVFTYAEPVISPDARYVAFHSDASNLVGDDANGARDVFLRDRQTDTTTLLSRNSSGAGGNRSSFTTALSADFRVAAFESDADNFAPGDRGYVFRDVFVRDLDAGTTRLVSRRSPFLPETNLSAAGSQVVSTTTDGRYVAFFSHGAGFLRPSDLVTGVSFNGPNLFVRDTLTGQLTVENIQPDGVSATGVFGGQISADARFSAFDNRANLDPDVPTPLNTLQAFVRDRQAGTTRMVSVTPSGEASAVSVQAGSVALSPDGRYVAFSSPAGDLVTGFVDGFAGETDVYLRDLVTGTTRLVSHLPASATTSGNGFSNSPVFSPDGGKIAFLSRATDLVAGVADGNGHYDLFLYDIASATVSLATIDPAGTAAGDSSMAFDSFAFTADGRYLFFSNSSSNLTADPNAGGKDLFRRDLLTGTTTLVSIDLAGTSASAGDGAFSITPDGRHVAFWSGSNNLVAGDTNNRADVFVRDLTTGTNTLVSLNTGGSVGGNQDSTAPVISPDGRFVSFTSLATDLTPDLTDINGPLGFDLFVRDTLLGVTLPASAGNSGTTGGSVSTDPSKPRFFSPDGRTLYFTSLADNLYSGDRNAVDDGFAFEIRGAGRITGKVSDGTGAGIPSWTVYIDANDNRRFDPEEANVQTDPAGNYAFSALAAGTHRVGVRLADGFAPTTPTFRDVVLATETSTATGQDFGAAVAQVDLRVRDVTIADLALFAGTSTTIGWEVQNLGDDDAIGDWQDAVYLSADATLDAGDTLLAVVPQTGGLVAGEGYLGTASVRMPATLTGSHHVFVRTDRRLQVVGDGNRGNNLGRSVDRVDLSIPTLTLDVPFGAQFEGANHDRHFQVVVPAGETVTVVLDSAAATGATELYARFGAPAAPFSFDHAAIAANQADQRLAIPLTQPGTYFILARGRSGDAADGAFTITAAVAPFDLVSVAPNAGPNAGSVTLEIQGTAMTPDSLPRLLQGATAIEPSRVVFHDPTLIFATFDLAGAPLGGYAMELIDGPETDTLPDAFTVNDAPAVTDSLSLELTVPSTVRAGRQGKILVEYVNTGSVDIAAPELMVTATDALFRLPGQTAFTEPSLTFVGLPPFGPADTLRPGQRGSLEVDFLSTGPIGRDIEITLESAAGTRMTGDGHGFRGSPLGAWRDPPPLPRPRRGRIPVNGSGDPNDITGPAGVGEERYVAADAALPYRIRFENVATATAPAQEVFVTHTLDADVDLASFRFGDFGFGSLEVDVPDGLQSYTARLGYTNLMNGGTPLFVDVSAELDADARTATWVLRAVDPATGELPEGVFDGFLPPNDATRRGEGFFTYTARPLAGLATGVTIDAQASIVFDTNAAILTNVFTNTIDGDAPTGTVNPLPPVSTATTFPVWWDAHDPAGAGFDSVDVHVSVDGGPYALWLGAPTGWTADYPGEFGHRYDFVAIARDLAGNRQPFPASPQASIRVSDVPTALDDAFAVADGRTKSGNVLKNDSNPAPKRKLTAVVVDGPSFASSFDLKPNGKFSYTPGPGWTGRDSFTYQIVDDQGGESNIARVELATHLAGFRATKVKGAEKKGVVTLVVDLTAAAAADVTLTYVVAPRTARPRGEDFTLASGTLPILAGQKTATLEIPLSADGLDEDAESFQVWLTGATGPAALGKSRTATVTLADADPKPKIAFATAASAGLESDSPLLEVTLDRPSGRAVTVRYSVIRSNSSALPGSDFELATGTLTFPAGTTTLTVPLLILDDTADEVDERVVVKLSRPKNAAMGPFAVHTYTIQDDDAPPILAFGPPAAPAETVEEASRRPDGGRWPEP